MDWFWLVISISVVAILFFKEFKQTRKDMLFWSNKEEVARLAQHLEEVCEQSRKFADAHHCLMDHLDGFITASDNWHKAIEVCIKKPHPTKIDIAAARSASRGLVEICQQGLGADYNGFDYEKIMADTYKILAMLKT